MLIKDILFLLKEYNSSKTNTTLAAKGGEKASGKNFDNIITGKAQPYKETEYETKYAKVFPQLSTLVKKVKSQLVKGDIQVVGTALAELQELLKSYRPRNTKDGALSLPFGDNVRLKNYANNFILALINPKIINLLILKLKITT
jgi:hypothetical protein